MRKDNILDLGLYFIEHTIHPITKNDVHDFIVLVDILELEHHGSCFSDSDYILNNCRVEVVSLNEILINDIDFKDIFIESEESYDTFSIAMLALLEKAIFICNYDKKTLEQKIASAIPPNTTSLFSDELYRCVLSKKYPNPDLVQSLIDDINHHKYIYKTFAI